MTQEQKAKAYDEALKDMRVIYPNLSGDAKLAVEHAFPQLTESEDERIRKEIISALKFANDGGVYDKHITYLEKKKEQKSINLHDKIEELCSKYPINKYSMSDKELSAYHQGVHLGARKIAEYLSEQRSIELSEEEIIKTIKTEISQFGTTAYENYTHDSSDKEYWTYMTCKKITNLINSLCNGN